MNYIVGILGMYVFSDGLASLWAYTGDSDRSNGQTFWRDHALRCVRCLVGITLVIIGAYK